MKLYQHFTGGLYVVIDREAVDVTNGIDDTKRDRIAYYSLDEDKLFVRDFHEFHENVEYAGKTGPRFRVIMDAADIMPEGGHP